MKKRLISIINGNLIKSIETLIDLIIVFGSIFIFTIFYYFIQNLALPNLINELLATFSSIASYSTYLIIVFILFRIYRPSIFERSFLSAMKSITVSLVLANIVLIIFTFIAGTGMMMNSTGVFGVLFVQLVLFTFVKYFSHKFLSGLLLTKIMIIGTKDEAQELAINFFQDSDHNKFITYILFEENGELPKETFELMNEVDDIYMTPSLKDYNKQITMQHATAQLSKDIHIIPKTYEISLINAEDISIEDTLLFHIPMMRLSAEQRFIKRTFDIFVSLILLILLLPVFAFVAIGIKLDDHGSVYYKQQRFKRNNEPFYVYKFRSMVINGSNKRASKNDIRITKMGKFLRASRIDELPQLFNVLKGDMSLVGPRPLIKEEIDEAIKEIPEFYYRMNVKPGLTGLAQVKGKYDTPAKEKIRYDLLYVKKASFFYDLKILILTVKVIFSKGSTTDDENKTLYDYLKKHSLFYEEKNNVMHIMKDK